MSIVKNEEEPIEIIVGETDAIALATKTKRAYNIADIAAREYLALPGLRSYQGLIATIGTALTNSEEEFPGDMREVVLQDKLNEYKPKI